MADRPIVAPNVYNPVINAVSMATTVTGAATVIQRIPGISYDVSWTGTPTGTFSVQVSNSVVLGPNGSIIKAGNWTNLPTAAFLDTLPVPSGSASHGFINVNPNIQAYAIRLIYTPSGGTGSLTVIPSAKVL